jgi:16S rRNA (guanine966-N2)-methyltransferase
MRRPHNTLRIIGGQWRGRRITFPDSPGLRPTPDRIRETLFNWLMPIVRDSRCLDLFAGSGALGIEALSRGAQHVTFVDVAPLAISHINEALKQLGCTKASVYLGHIPGTLHLPFKPFHIVFVDPPFNQGLIAPVCAWLEANDLLSDPAYIYLETEKDLSSPKIPENWQRLKHKSAGQVNYSLYKRNSYCSLKFSKPLL